ncbi:MAG TPA: hypothetical protein VEC14_07370 [Reyranellaceae bacterium]|nr:hypothetical protein [Reyranellaceae bacterium]
MSWSEAKGYLEWLGGAALMFAAGAAVIWALGRLPVVGPQVKAYLPNPYA